jgi:hypothetical protein
VVVLLLLLPQVRMCLLLPLRLRPWQLPQHWLVLGAVSCVLAPGSAAALAWPLLPEASAVLLRCLVALLLHLLLRLPAGAALGTRPLGPACCGG